MVTGFFLICGIDVALHMLLGPYLHSHTHNNDNNQVKEEMEMKYITVKTESIGDSEVEINRNKSGDNTKTNPVDDPPQTLDEQEKKMTSAMRTFFVVFALSFHAVMDGLALSLLEDVGDVWISFAAISLHKGGLIHTWYLRN